MLCDIELPRYQYVLYRKSTLQERVVVMYYNEKKKKAKYEMLFKVYLKNKIMACNKIN